MQYTPGPWKVDGESGNPSEAETIVAADGSRVIAWTCNTFDENADDGYGAEVITAEDRANARLIALAPQMYDIICECAACWNKYNDSEAPTLSEAMDRIINKVTGRDK